MKSNGWNDIGYNFLVDRYGTVYEGRAGGVDRNVIGAHALGFNTGSVGVAVMGTFTSAAAPAAVETSLAKLLAWRLDLAHVDPLVEAVRHLGRQRALRLGDAGSATGSLRPPRHRAHDLPRRSAVRADRRDRGGGAEARAAEAVRAEGDRRHRGARALPGTRLERAPMDGDGFRQRRAAARRRERAGADGRLDVGLDLGGRVRASRAPAGASTSPAPRPPPARSGSTSSSPRRRARSRSPSSRPTRARSAPTATASPTPPPSPTRRTPPRR